VAGRLVRWAEAARGPGPRLIHQPRLLLLDEPLGALDALTRIEMQQLIERLWQQHGFTVLLVTHDVSEAVPLLTG
jgi:sulfonate transport system ATP-binding protein